MMSSSLSRLSLFKVSLDRIGGLVTMREDIKQRCLENQRLFRAAVVLAALTLLALFFELELIFHREAVTDAGVKSLVFSKENNYTITGFARKLLQSADDGGDTNRFGTSCSKNDIVIFQGSTAPLPNGIPAYTVQILNVCASGCNISNIHVSCGWFSSARLVNPRVFRRLYYDDCLVNNGEPLGPGETLSFQYANSFRYPLSISTVVCC